MFIKIFTIFILLASLPAFAQDRAMVEARVSPAQKTGKNPECTMTETAQVGVSFNNVNVDLAEVQAVIDQKIDAIKLLGKDAGVENLRIQSYNYNVYNNSGGNCCDGDCGGSGAGHYQYNGSVNFNVEPLAKAAGFADLLSKNGYSANLNVNAYSQCQ